MILGVGRELAHVFGMTQRPDPRARAVLELAQELRRDYRVEQLLLAGEVFVQVAHRGTRPLCHNGHRGCGIAELRDRARRRPDEGVMHLGLADLDHEKRTIYSLLRRASALTEKLASAQ